MKIAFSLMIHNSTDERVAYQEAHTLRCVGDDIEIFSAYELKEKSRKEKTEWLLQQLLNSKPNVIVCDTPLSVEVAHRAKKIIGKDTRVVYDITEWYPSKKNIRNFPFYKKLIRVPLLSLASLWAGFLTDAFLFGEYYKSFPFRYLFFLKPSLFLAYYASKTSVKKIPPKDSLGKECILYYSGNLTREKGYCRVVSLAKKVAEKRPSIQFVLRVVSPSVIDNKDDQQPNLRVEYLNWMTFPQFCETVGENDIFLDLRDDDFENTHCLPIKLFYYMSAGRPMIYSDLKAIHKGVPEFETMGCLSKPDDESKMISFILNCVDNSDFYRQHCQNSLNLSFNKYNWENIENQLVKFIHDGI
ncbi:MAG: hypothetical protein MJZ34_04595 [Paludibacteraceae bacterium]|nr:hypothetical protein [Paludibacteraceae bacterium]